MESLFQVYTGQAQTTLRHPWPWMATRRPTEDRGRCFVNPGGQQKPMSGPRRGCQTRGCGVHRADGGIFPAGVASVKWKLQVRGDDEVMIKHRCRVPSGRIHVNICLSVLRHPRW